MDRKILSTTHVDENYKLVWVVRAEKTSVLPRHIKRPVIYFRSFLVIV